MKELHGHFFFRHLYVRLSELRAENELNSRHDSSNGEDGETDAEFAENHASVKNSLMRNARLNLLAHSRNWEYCSFHRTSRSNVGPKFQTITDTLGRVISFQYDSSNRLISATGPRMQDEYASYGYAKRRTLLRLHYKPHTLSYSFASGVIPMVREQTVDVIDSIYYPATSTGYWFNDDADSYSSYGMLTKVIEQRGMTYASGVIGSGQMTKQALYNYPLTTLNATDRTNGIGLSDAPTYTKLTESWAEADVTEPAITTYLDNYIFV